MRTIAWLVCISVVSGVAVSAAADHKDDDEAIQEAIFRDYLKDKGKGKFPYFLAVDGDDDPSDALLRRLADLKLDLRKGSRQTSAPPSADNTGRNVFDRETKESGMLLFVDRISHDDPLKVKVEFTRYAGKLNASVYECTLQKVGGKWKLQKRDHIAES